MALRSSQATQRHVGRRECFGRWSNTHRAIRRYPNRYRSAGIAATTRIGFLLAAEGGTNIQGVSCDMTLAAHKEAILLAGIVLLVGCRSQKPEGTSVFLSLIHI